MRKSELALWAFLLLSAAALGATTVSLSRTQPAVAANAEIYEKLDLFGEVLEHVRSDYVEKPDDKKLIEQALKGMLSSLDPHSAYLSEKEYKDMQIQTRGEFGGLGIEVTKEKDFVTVVAPIEGTPAQKAGILAGDKITHLDGDSIVGVELNQAVSKMRGPRGKAIVLTIARKGRPDPFDVKLVRATIPIIPVKSRAEDDVAYIKITQFNEQTYSRLKEKVQKLDKEIGDELKGYIIDLRNNPGGLLHQAIEVSNAFLDKGAIVMTKGRVLAETQRSNARKGDITKGKKVIVLINGGSASASEIVAGALQDHGRAQIIGTRSFGKGSVQTIIPLGHDGSKGAIRMTTARYYTPSNRSIQAKGINPDIVVEQELPEELKKSAAGKPHAEASLRGHLKSSDGDESAGSSAFVPREAEKDKQLQYALNLLRGIKVENKAKPETAEKETVPN